MVVIITLDYELFLNDKTGSVRNCLEKPIAEIQKICDKFDVHYTVFVDAAYLYMLNKLKETDSNLIDDFNTVCAHLRWIQSKGHDIELHLHPQWYYSEYKNGEWVLDWEHYRMGDLDEECALRLFNESKCLLDGIIGKETTIFRAGGYSLPGFDYNTAFEKNGMIADSSVLPGIREITSTHVFDYRKLPEIPYRFSDDVLQPKDNGSFIELPISLSKKYFITKYLSIKKKNISNVDNINWGDGGDLPQSNYFKRIRRIMSSFSLYKRPKASIDYQSFFFLRDAYDAAKDNDYLIIIGHPKNFSPSSLKYLDGFIEDCLANKDSFMTAEEYCWQVIRNLI